MNSFENGHFENEEFLSMQEYFVDNCAQIQPFKDDISVLGAG